MIFPNLGRQFLVPALKVFDLFIMVAGLALASWVVTLQAEGASSFLALLTLRLKIGNVVLLLGLLVVWHLIYSVLGLYHPRRLTSRWVDARDSITAPSLGCLAILNAGILFKIDLVVSLSFLGALWAVSTTLTVSSRMTLRTVLDRFRAKGRNLRYVLIVGTNLRAQKFARKLEARPELGYRVLGFADEEWDGIGDFREGRGEVIAGLDDLCEYFRHHVVDEVVIGLPLLSSYERSCRVVRACEEQGITARFLSDLFNLKLAKATVEWFQDEPVITLQTGAMEGPGMVAKRGLDFVLSLILLVALSPLLVLIAGLIRLSSPGPVLFVQKRVGLNKRIFELYKFRTMVADAEDHLEEVEHLNEVSGPVFKIENDPRITRFGKLLRRTSLDELPQLLNVIKGEMSLVGPRPLPVRDYEGFCEDRHRRRCSVRPGVTCLWQVTGRSEIPFERWMELDMEYIDHWSLWLDFKIMMQTIPAVLKGTGAS